MPSLDVSMARTLRRGLLEQLTAPLVRHPAAAAALSRRDLISQAKDGVTDAKTAFSSWDNCMQASFCKWPVIAVIVIGGLILLSVVWCVARCACCGRAFCCSAFECLKCCGNCCGCCDPPGERRHKYKDEPYTPPNQAYQRNAPMQTPPGMAAPGHPQQYAEFDMSKKRGDDSLPHMPSWEGSSSRKVMVEDEEVELDTLNKVPVSTTVPLLRPSTSSGPPTPVAAAAAAAAAAAPNSMYGQARNGPADYFPVAADPSAMRAEPSPFGPRPPPLRSYPTTNSQQARNPYGPDHDPDGYGLDEPYDDPAPPSNLNRPYTSTPSNANGFAGPLGPRQPSPALARDGYAQPAARKDPGWQGGGMRRPAYDANPWQGPGRQASADSLTERYAPRRQGTGDSVGNRSPLGMDPRLRASPAPVRTPRLPGEHPFTSSPSPSPGLASPGPGRRRPGENNPPPLSRPILASAARRSPPQSPITNNAGFDFTSGFSRPATANSNRPNPSPPEAYPGYKPYQPSQPF